MGGGRGGWVVGCDWGLTTMGGFVGQDEYSGSTAEVG